ncbi:MAG: hypothetical protein IJ584_13735 [Bacteroidales bacterium]|nr:hypothetical protein [Bacteroidales bacterium]
MEDKPVQKVEDLEINVLYMLTQVFELLMNDFERRVTRHVPVVRNGQVVMVEAGCGFKREKKQQFKRLVKTLQDLHTQFDLLYNDIVYSAEDKGWKELDLWASDANDLARMVLLWADKCGPYPDHMEQVFRLMKTYKGEGIITDEVLEHFHMK